MFRRTFLTSRSAATGGLVASLLLTPLLAFGTTFSGTTITTSTGTVTTWAISNATSGLSNMGGMLVAVTWADNTVFNCVWVNGSGCSVANGFSVTETDGANGTFNGTWSLTNLRAASNIRSIMLNGLGTPSGRTVFDTCWNGSNPGTIDLTPGNGCGTATGTAGSNQGYTAWSASGGSNAPSPSTVVYSNRINTYAGNAVGDLWGMVTINFTNNGFVNGDTFTWRMDTDLVTTPEPATAGFVGLALVAFGCLRFRRHRTRQDARRIAPDAPVPR
jgi:hypothetical protein